MGEEREGAAAAEERIGGIRGRERWGMYGARVWERGGEEGDWEERRRDDIVVIMLVDGDCGFCDVDGEEEGRFSSMARVLKVWGLWGGLYK